MARREKLRALVLSRKDINEADRLITLFSRPYGIIRVMAKGVRRIPSRRGGHLEPLTEVLCIVTGSEGRRYLAAAETENEYSQLHANDEAISHMSMLVRALLGFFREEEPREELFDAFCQACDLLPTLPSHKKDALEIALMLVMLRQSGIFPALKACTECGQGQPVEAVVLDASVGGWRCLSCHQSFQGTHASLPIRLLKALRWLGDYPHRALMLRFEPLESRQLLVAVRSYVETAAEMPLKPNWNHNQTLASQNYA